MDIIKISNPEDGSPILEMIDKRALEEPEWSYKAKLIIVNVDGIPYEYDLEVIPGQGRFITLSNPAGFLRG